MRVQVQAPLLSVLHTRPDFRPAFDPLQRMAQQWVHNDPVAAQGVIDTLTAIEARRAPVAAPNLTALP